MWTLVSIAIVLWFIWAIFKKVQEKERHGSDRPEDEVEATQFKERSRVKSKLTGAVVGAIAGSFVGIAALGGAIGGAIPCAIVGWFVCGNR